MTCGRVRTGKGNSLLILRDTVKKMPRTARERLEEAKEAYGSRDPAPQHITRLKKDRFAGPLSKRPMRCPCDGGAWSVPRHSRQPQPYEAIHKVCVDGGDWDCCLLLPEIQQNRSLYNLL